MFGSYSPAGGPSKDLPRQSTLHKRLNVHAGQPPAGFVTHSRRRRRRRPDVTSEEMRQLAAALRIVAAELEEIQSDAEPGSYTRDICRRAARQITRLGAKLNIATNGGCDRLFSSGYSRGTLRALFNLRVLDLVDGPVRLD
jgi:hypothetical protein